MDHNYTLYWTISQQCHVLVRSKHRPDFFKYSISLLKLEIDRELNSELRFDLNTSVSFVKFCWLRIAASKIRLNLIHLVSIVLVTAHVIFDDAFVPYDDGIEEAPEVNDYVKNFVKSIPTAAT